ncbi:hypothetical protein PR048_011100 [Dryococelus australis]|uniref:DUF4371 domain-containing protein n=1 Tax=Dryococelus australis TaxID=614101 RepID=A0ABQ9HL75_9NEOP|nr:hypothetical protein PR048_011100 [Dryococelus australis]
MMRLVSISCTLSKGGKPLRGHDECKDSNKKGLFLEVVALFQKYDPFMKSYVQKAQKHCTYLSNRIQNYILQAFKKIGEEMKGDCISIIADETSYVGHHEQLAVFFRLFHMGRYCLLRDLSHYTS